MEKRTRKKRKRKWLRNTLLIALLIIVPTIIYSVYQYNSGLTEASDGFYKDDGKTFDPFEGPEPQFGEINILLMGSDARPNRGGLSDTLMIAHYNQKTHNIKLASIMRDTYVEVPGHGKQKINAAFAFGGPELVRKTILQNFDLDINYYAVVDFQGFPKIIDIVAPNGIDVDIPNEMKYGIGMTLHPGKQTLHGDELLGYVRFRHDSKSDFGRVERQQEVLSKAKVQAISVHSLVNLPKLLGIADPYIDTNLDKRTILTIGKGLLIGKEQQMETLRIPVKDSFKDERVNVGSVLSIDFDKNKQALHEFLSGNGESATETDLVYPKE